MQRQASERRRDDQEKKERVTGEPIKRSLEEDGGLIDCHKMRGGHQFICSVTRRRRMKENYQEILESHFPFDISFVLLLFGK